MKYICQIRSLSDNDRENYLLFWVTTCISTASVVKGGCVRAVLYLTNGVGSNFRVLD